MTSNSSEPSVASVRTCSNVAEVAAQRQVLARAGDDPDGVDADGRPEIVVVVVVRVLVVHVVFVDVRVVVIRVVGGIVRADDLDVVIGRFVFVLGGSGGLQFGFGGLDGLGVDLRSGDDPVDGIEHIVPVLGDEASDAHPQIGALAAVEVAGSGRDGADDGVAVEELGDRGQLADLAEDAHDLERVLEFGDDLRGGVLGGQFGYADEVVAVAFVGHEFVGLETDDRGPRRVLDEIVVVAVADERGELGDTGQHVEILVESEEGLPLVVTLAPARCPQCEAVSVGESELNRDDVSGHGDTA
jgi:hypothetical protein